MKTILGSLLILLMSGTAQAGFMVEPYLGYGSGTGKCGISVLSVEYDCGTTATSIAFGSRIGYQFGNGLFVGGDFATTSGGKMKFTDTATFGTEENDFTHTTMGASFGYQHSGGFRTFLTYNVTNDLKVEEDKFTGGTNYRLGIGYKFAKMVAVNLEYAASKPKSYSDDGAAAVDVDTVYTKFETTTTMLTVSFPFNFGGK